MNSLEQKGKTVYVQKRRDNSLHIRGQITVYLQKRTDNSLLIEENR